MERFLGDEALRRGWQVPVDAAPTGKRVLVVGAGPSGLSAAYHLTRLGHAVTIMYPNSALSAGQLVLIAVVPVLCLAIWLIGVFVAAREPRRRDSGAGMTSLPQHPADMDEPQRKAA